MVASILVYRLVVLSTSGSPGPAIFVVLSLGAGLVLLRPRLAVLGALVAGATLFPADFGYLTVAGIQLTAAELLTYVAVGAWLLSVITKTAAPAPRVLRPVLFIVLAAALAAAVGLFNGSRSDLVQAQLRLFGLYLLVFPICAFFATEKGKQTLENSVVWIASLSAAVQLGLTALGLKIYSDSPLNLDTFGRLSDVQRVRPAAIQLTVLALLILSVRIARTGWRPTSAVQLTLCTYVIIASFTRIVWLSAALAIVLALRFRPGRRNPWRAARSLVVAAVVLPLGLVLGTSGSLGPFGTEVALRAQSTFDSSITTTGSYKDRQNETKVAIKTIGENPLLGVGLGQTFGVRSPVYDDRKKYTLFVERDFIHNSWLLAWLQLGALGVASMVMLVVAVARQARGCTSMRNQEAGARVLVGALALLAFGISSFVQPQLVHRPSILAFCFAIGLLVRPTPERSRE